MQTFRTELAPLEYWQREHISYAFPSHLCFSGLSSLSL